MNKRQKSKLASFIAAEAVLRGNPEVASVPGLPERVEALSAKVGEINSLAIKQTQPTQASTLGRDQRIEEMVRMALGVAGVVQTMAHAGNLQELGRLVRADPGIFRRLSVFDRVWLARRIQEAAQAHLPELASYGVTAETLAALRSRIDVAEALLQQPRLSVVERRAATQQLDTRMREVEGLLKLEIDRLVLQLQEGQPGFYAAYVAARSVVDRRSGKREKDTTSEPASEATPTPALVLTPLPAAQPQAA